MFRLIVVVKVCTRASLNVINLGSLNITQVRLENAQVILVALALNYGNGKINMIHLQTVTDTQCISISSPRCVNGCQ